MPNIKLVIEYDGSRYHGWQRQPNLPTVQGALEAAVDAISQQRPTVIGAGRTDAGVHAQGQVANFKVNARLTSAAWMRALNSLLPEDIVVVGAQKVSSRFHARFSAVGKIYHYRILNRRYPPAIGRQYVWTVYSALDLRRMRSAAKALLGKHDFSSFRGSDSSEVRVRGKKRSAVCRIRRLELARRRDHLVITIEADRFLQQMVRTIVGTLVEVGRGRFSPRDIPLLLQKKDRRFGGPTAPPQGLCLVKVFYK
ncbi:MAG TPA: tRNA pseudouridine(38-40) synthase TruA [Nitrospiria bacterium]|jgi:tRNA pseudouridine38-40 synthase|nr:tRNA pseudouridine(38-40) synthase TruA [Nitrospiria bacterium]